MQISQRMISHRIWLIAVAALLCAPPAEALQKCTAMINAKDGTILVSARDVEGLLSWGWSATTRIQPFFNAATCVNFGKAKKCTQGSPGTLLAITPPPDCTLYLTDGSGTCTAFIKKCTPGTRLLVEFPVRFIDNGDGTVSDTRTGLMWEKKADGGGIRGYESTYNWSTGSPYDPDGTAFFTFLATLNGPTLFAGYGDWRLPTLAELRTILDLTQGNCGGGSGPCLDQAVFGPTQASGYWSADTGAGAPFTARSVSFLNGSMVADSKATNTYVRAVRGGW